MADSLIAELSRLETVTLDALDKAAQQYLDKGRVDEGWLTMLRDLDMPVVIARRAAKLAGRKLRTCDPCGRSMTAQRSTRRYCSDAWRVASRRARQRKGQRSTGRAG